MQPPVADRFSGPIYNSRLNVWPFVGATLPGSADCILGAASDHEHALQALVPAIAVRAGSNFSAKHLLSQKRLVAADRAMVFIDGRNCYNELCGIGNCDITPLDIQFSMLELLVQRRRSATNSYRNHTFTVRHAASTKVCCLIFCRLSSP